MGGRADGALRPRRRHHPGAGSRNSLPTGGWGRAERRLRRGAAAAAGVAAGRAWRGNYHLHGLEQQQAALMGRAPPRRPNPPPGSPPVFHQHVLARQQHLPDRGGVLGWIPSHRRPPASGLSARGPDSCPGQWQPQLAGERVGRLIPGGDRHHPPALACWLTSRQKRRAMAPALAIPQRRGPFPLLASRLTDLWQRASCPEPPGCCRLVCRLRNQRISSPPDRLVLWSRGSAGCRQKRASFMMWWNTASPGSPSAGCGGDRPDYRRYTWRR